MHISIIKRINHGSANFQTHKVQREIKECLHIQNTKQITIINLFNKLAAVAADASMCLQICGPMPDSYYNGNVHYKWKVLYILEFIHWIPYQFFISQLFVDHLHFPP